MAIASLFSSAARQPRSLRTLRVGSGSRALAEFRAVRGESNESECFMSSALSDERLVGSVALLPRPLRRGGIGGASCV